MSTRVDVWVADATAMGDKPARLLSAAEHDQAARFIPPAARDMFVASRMLQRILGGRYLGIPPADVSIGRRCALCGDPAHGRPYLVDGGDLDYSVSHSGTLVAIGYVTGSRVGIDIEAVDRRLNIDELGDQVLTPAERDQLAGLAGVKARSAFLARWTRKEAVIKLTGHGLIVPLSSIDVTGHTAMVAPEPTGWPTTPIWLSEVDVGAGYSGALACTAEAPSITVRRAESLLR